LNVWRLCASSHTAFDGEGARLAGGRWNPKGTAIVYTSATLSLAAQELFVHLDPADLPPDLVAVSAIIPDSVRVEVFDPDRLPRNWREYPAPESLAAIGASWAASAKSAALAVPSVVIPQERNYLLNPSHSDFSRITILDPSPFTFDSRMWKRR
jgi:RES domain-containing protein